MSRGRVLRLSAAALALSLLIGCAGQSEPPPQGRFKPVSYESLRGWGADEQSQALPALKKSCAVWKKKKNKDWGEPCRALEELSDQTSTETVRKTIEEWFVPYAPASGKDGLFTGYYEATLRGSLKKSKKYSVPLYEKPRDFLTANLNDFGAQCTSKKIVGKKQKDKFVPFDTRAQIASGSLKGRAKPLVWVDDPVGAFFMEIQGSGRIILDKGGEIRLGYAAQNGHGYTPIGRVLADRGEIERPVTMEKIRCWMAAHPKQRQAIMNTNPSFIFFRVNHEEGPVGAQGVSLTPQRSLAVDPSFITLGAPLWLETPNRQRLVVAQDTGGAIKGEVRGDFFWGSGPEAERSAGAMQETGTYYILLPKTVSP